LLATRLACAHARWVGRGPHCGCYDASLRRRHRRWRRPSLPTGGGLRSCDTASTQGGPTDRARNDIPSSTPHHQRREDGSSIGRERGKDEGRMGGREDGMDGSPRVHTHTEGPGLGRLQRRSLCGGCDAPRDRGTARRGSRPHSTGPTGLGSPPRARRLWQETRRVRSSSSSSSSSSTSSRRQPRRRSLFPQRP
jgi:hypothetical protein